MEKSYFPNFAPLELEHKPLLHPRLSLGPDGVSEFTFAGLYLFRHGYSYQVSWGGGDHEYLIVSGGKNGKKFFLTPCGVPEQEVLEELFRTHDFWKNIPLSLLESAKEKLEPLGIQAVPDRDNFDYLYRREDLAELSGKKYHKKRNQVNGFTMNYQARREKLSHGNAADALNVLDAWKEGREEQGDYTAAREALELLAPLKLRGAIWYEGNRPIGWCLGESLARGRSFAEHFEKGLEDYRGVYQYINQDFAASLPSWYRYINREQDLGDPGMRQAKETYRPAAFVEKFRAGKDGAW